MYNLNVGYPVGRIFIEEVHRSNPVGMILLTIQKF
jgi:hypothetical protein